MRSILALGVWVFALAESARAFVTSSDSFTAPARWNLTAPFGHPNVVNPQTRAIRYFIGQTYSTANRDAEAQAIRNSFLQWQAVPGTILKFEEGGLAPGLKDVHSDDNTNSVFWTHTSALLVDDQLDYISGITGVTYSRLFGSTFVEGDIVLNGEFGWFTDYNNPVPNAYFAEAVALHEIGHFIGLDHSPLGGSTMYVRSASGVTVQAELSDDEIAAARFLYGTAAMNSALARLGGTVTMNSTGVFGAVVVIEDPSGRTVGGTVTRADGQYEFAALTPGTYRARVTPLDPVSASSSGRLTTGWDIEGRFSTAETGFLPTASQSVALTAGQKATLNFPVVPGTPAFRITRLRTPATNPDFLVVVNSADGLSPGQSNTYVGVYSPDLPASEATLTITGDGITTGPAIFRPSAFPGLNLISLQVSVAANATPGLRSFVVQQGQNVAYAHGFLKILSSFPDINRDGFDDRFQRQYFLTPFAPEAASSLDPDQDGYDNYAEYISGSNPKDAASVLRLESIRWDASGATIRWASAPGKRYQVSSRLSAESARGWINEGNPIVATGAFTEFLDTANTTPTRLYRVEALP